MMFLFCAVQTYKLANLAHFQLLDLDYIA